MAVRFRFSPLILIPMLVFAGCVRAAGDPVDVRPVAPGNSPGVAIDKEGVRHSGIRVPAGAVFTWKIAGAAKGRLRFGWSAKTAGAVTLRVNINGRSEEAVHRFDFDTFDLPVDERGPVTIRLAPSPAAEVVISDLRIVQPSDRNDAVIMILFDTTRRDAVGLYGSVHPTTPNLDRILAGAWKADRAYAAASWTIPSCAALLTGMVPEVHEDDSGTPIGIAADVPTIGMDFEQAGWSTAEFNANPTLNATNGFDRGFTTFYTPPYEVSSMTLPGSDTLKRVPQWLRAHEGEKFFLYIHLIDPHEPYGAPDRPKGTTPFDPDYHGAYTGDESHYSLMFDTKITQRDIEHLRALYDDDVRYDDMLIGRFWDGLSAPLRGRTTLVFVSDHGEEFHEHLGWKHGPALYDEVLRVPLLIRSGNGRPALRTPAGALVSLIDVLPTLEHVLGIPLNRKVNGVDLTDPKNAERAVLPAIHMLTGGAARAVVVRGWQKLFFFDRFGARGIPDPKADPLGNHVAYRLREITPSLCLFDLRHDPGETRQLPPVTNTKGTDWRAIEESIAHTRRGIEVRVFGGPQPSRVRFSISVPSTEAETFAAEPDDKIASDGKTTTFDLTLTPGDVDGVLLKSTSEGGAHVVLQDGCARLNGGPMTRGSALTLQKIQAGIPRLDLDPTCASIYVWRSTGERYFRSKEEADEARKKLRAIGYIQ